MTRKKEREKLLARREETNQKLVYYSSHTSEDLLKLFDEDASIGMTEDKLERAKQEFGENIIVYKNKNGLIHRIFKAFINPFSMVLIALAIVSFMVDYVFGGDKRDATAAIIIVIMVALSGLLRFIQEERSNKAGEKLKSMIRTTATVIRDGKSVEIPISELVTGDIIKIAAGDMIPADIRILTCKDLFIRQSSMTGEAEPVEKSVVSAQISANPLELTNLAFMGTNVISGAALAIVLLTGNDSFLGSMAKSITEKRGQTNFDKGVNSVSWLLIRFMAIMVPIVFVINGITIGDWLQALLFSMSIAVGLTPEMLPMIVASNLAKGALNMSKHKVIVKNLNAIQSFGSMDVLCTDKTGTLTEDKIVLERHLNVNGEEDERVLRHGYANSYYQTGLKNLMDIAILEYGASHGITELNTKYEKIDEIPFDFLRRRMSVVLKDKTGKTQVITKGAIEEMLSICKYCELDGRVVELNESIIARVNKKVDELNGIGMRMIAVSQKNVELRSGAFSVSDESDMVLIGYIGFLDPPKVSCKDAIVALGEYGVNVKVLTGDNDKVTKYVCETVGIKIQGLLLGSQIESMSHDELQKAVEENNIFAKLNPQQKATVVSALQANGHTVGFMGDGINDAPAMRKADVGISVDTAVDIAKESADIILLEKDLMVLERGILAGRKTFGNIVKYIKMTASSNFGNMLSVLVASAFLPFLPMEPIQILILGLLYDISCISIVWDNIDVEYLKKPRTWNAKSIGSFMLWIGPISSIFDIATYLVLYYVVCPQFCGAYTPSNLSFVALFHAGWFVESLVTQTLVIHMIRSRRLPFIQSHASLPVMLSTLAAISVGILIPFTPIGKYFLMSPLPAVYFAYLLAIVAAYMVTVTLVKTLYVKKYGSLL